MKIKYLCFLSNYIFNFSTLIISLCMVSAVLTSAQLPDKIRSEAARQVSYSFAFCKYLHRNPELSLKEFETSKRIADELKKAGLEVTEKFGGNNVVGILRNGTGPSILIRTDMDALPIEEKTGLEFASDKKSVNSDGDEVAVMHACGHDIHMSTWLGTIRALVSLKEEWHGTLVVIAQQAEEISGGSGLAIETGLFKRFPKPDFALAFHINPEIESGKIGLAAGPVFAGVKTASIVVYGVGGHGAYPEKCIDPIVIASRIVLDLQTIVSREISPLEPVVITVGSIHGGTRPNIIPDEVKMELTLRYYSDEAIRKVISAIKRISESAAQMAGMPDNKLPLVSFTDAETPPVVNHPELSSKVAEYAAQIIGSENIEKVNPAMVGEDFGKYGRTADNVPICLIWLGSTNSDLMKELNARKKKPAPLHSPYLKPDYELTIKTGIKIMTGNVIGLMKNKID